MSLVDTAHCFLYEIEVRKLLKLSTVIRTAKKKQLT